MPAYYLKILHISASLQKISFTSYSSTRNSYADAAIAITEMSFCLSVTLWYCIKTNKASIMISSQMESLNTILMAYIRSIPKFKGLLNETVVGR